MTDKLLQVHQTHKAIKKLQSKMTAASDRGDYDKAGELAREILKLKSNKDNLYSF
jgi:excinuclease UvrABC helicase subunit UvrB